VASEREERAGVVAAGPGWDAGEGEPWGPGGEVVVVRSISGVVAAGPGWVTGERRPRGPRERGERRGVNFSMLMNCLH
jgi:hypothetical protein